MIIQVSCGMTLLYPLKKEFGSDTKENETLYFMVARNAQITAEIRVKLFGTAHYTLHCVFDMQDELSEGVCNIIAELHDGATMILKTMQRHINSKSITNVQLKAVCHDQSFLSHSGIIFIDKYAVKTQAHQKSK